MSSGSVDMARGILRNAAALFLVGIFAKGMGLVIAVLVARFLGKDALGLFALLFSVAMLLEAFISIGMSDSLVRDVAARPQQASSLYRRALTLVGGISIIPALALGLWALSGATDPDMRASLLVVAIGTPISGAFVVSQAVLQGTERVLLLTWVTFLARLVSLIALFFAISQGAGVAAAFGSRVLFQAISVVIFFLALRHGAGEQAADFTLRSLLTRSVPFALYRALGELGVRLPALVLPGLVGLGSSGVFDTANRVRSTLGMTMSATIAGLMPSFARHFADPRAHPERLVGFSLKYMCLAMSVAATVINLCAQWLIVLLFGSTFAAASLLLQILVWAQVLVAMDTVLRQAMLAAGHEYPAVWHATLGLGAQLTLILLLAIPLDLPGVALAVLLSSAFTLALDLRFVLKTVIAVPVGQFVASPLAASSLVAVTMLALHQQSFVIRLLAVVGIWGVATALFRLLPLEELRFLRHLATVPRAKRGANSKLDL